MQRQTRLISGPDITTLYSSKHCRAMPSNLLSSGLLSIFALLPWALAQSCHFPDGSVASSDVPCNPSALVSACCFSDQACLSNGLCVSDPLNDTLKAYHRGTCTDQNFESSACPRFCKRTIQSEVFRLVL